MVCFNFVSRLFIEFNVIEIGFVGGVEVFDEPFICFEGEFCMSPRYGFAFAKDLRAYGFSAYYVAAFDDYLFFAVWGF
ncbi:hypothetical protein MCHI_001595 [Candidatus Magnetoovum chiemensis]|nr:hypothetical protein MCHI_001595 [Candidatus Magnetoovum chiemensis]